MFRIVFDRAARSVLEPIFARAAVEINGARPWDFRVHNERVFSRILLDGTLGFGESYTDGWWSTDDLEEFAYRIISKGLHSNFGLNLPDLVERGRSYLVNPQTRIGSRRVAEEHYDRPSEFYQSFLDPYNQYTCGYFKETEDLNQAQERKLDLICRKLYLSKADHVLDIGCGWGGFARFAAERYGCRVTGITISDVQMDYARKFCAGLPVDVVKCDYRDLKGSFDKVLICGMIEHVGPENYAALLTQVNRSLRPGGLFLLHTIGSNISQRSGDPWLHKYVFPNSVLPSLKQLATVSEGLFVLEDWQNLCCHYTKTLRAWRRNLAEAWEGLPAAQKRDGWKMWDFYFQVAAAGFRSRRYQLWQFLFSKGGVADGYEPQR